MQNALVNVNGQISPAENATVPVFDRGFLYGDSLYEVARSYDGTFFKLDEHLQRLFQSAALCRMKLSQSIADYQREILRTYQAYRNQPGLSEKDAYMRIIVTRGSGRIGFSEACVTTPTRFVILMLPIQEFLPKPEQIQNGVALKIVCRLRNDPRALDPAMKSGNYLNSVLAYLEASDEGFDDALLCNSDGHLTEGTTFNIFYVRDRVVATPPLDIGILDGITRRHVLSLCKDAGLETREVRFTPENLYEADEVFLTSSLKEVLAVSRIDQKRISSGKAGPVTLELRKRYQDSIGKSKSGT